jgi:hypothetical protein
VIINSGLWESFNTPPIIEELRRLREKNKKKRMIWKTTTFPKREQERGKFQSHMLRNYGTVEMFEKSESELSGVLKKQGWEIFNITYYIPPELYVDSLHFLPPVYKTFNEQLLINTITLPIGGFHHTWGNIFS